MVSNSESISRPEQPALHRSWPDSKVPQLPCYRSSGLIASRASRALERDGPAHLICLKRRPSLGCDTKMRTAVRLLALAGACVFFATSFRAGWNRSETDFPNYYTAAVLVRNGQPLHNYYEWTWFQRQMTYAGIENQLGGYIP